MKKTQIMYLGERVGFIGKVHQLFKGREGQEYNYKGVKGLRFGAVYVATDGRLPVHPEPLQKPNWVPSEKEELEYEAQKLAVSEYRSRQRGELQLRKPNPKIVQAVALLRPFYLSMPDIDRKRFMAWVSNECSKKGKRSKC